VLLNDRTLCSNDSNVLTRVPSLYWPPSMHRKTFPGIDRWLRFRIWTRHIGGSPLCLLGARRLRGEGSHGNITEGAPAGEADVKRTANVARIDVCECKAMTGP
jgi:hypothetical protein